MSVQDPEFIVTFIAEASKKGKVAVKAAKEEIEEIDRTLHEAEKLKIRRMKLVSVLDHFGDDTYRRRRSVSVPPSDDIGEESPEFAELRNKIETAISKKGPLTVRDLILEVGSYDQDTLIMRALKWLGDHEIVSRDDQGRVQPGKNWNYNE
jgi:hypothetical protein